MLRPKNIRSKYAFPGGLWLVWLSGAGCEGALGLDQYQVTTGTTKCGSQIVDLKTNRDNCGSCNHACPSNAQCVTGACHCPSGTQECNDQCVSLSQDSSNCGVCGHSCPSGTTCVSGTCQCPDPKAQQCGSNACVTLDSDAENCGSCGHACGIAQECRAGQCGCPGAGQSPCSNGCATLTSDANNCGSCGHACDTDQVCNNGQCGCPSPNQTACPNGCAYLTSDSSNCGGCGRNCATLVPNASTSCVNGSCNFNGCDSGYADCNGDANLASGNGCETQISSSVAHCGSCTHACAADQYCDSGTCRATLGCKQPCTTDAQCGSNVCVSTNNGMICLPLGCRTCFAQTGDHTCFSDSTTCAYQSCSLANGTGGSGPTLGTGGKPSTGGSHSTGGNPSTGGSHYTGGRPSTGGRGSGAAPGWTCSTSYYDALDGCDCDCGAWDPDCDVSSEPVMHCAASESCVLPGVCRASASITLKITDGCNDGKAIDYRFFDSDLGAVWPSATEYYETQTYGQTYTSILSCSLGSQICYGAALAGTTSSSYWGVGLTDAYGCDACCVTCTNSTSASWNLTCK